MSLVVKSLCSSSEREGVECARAGFGPAAGGVRGVGSLGVVVRPSDHACACRAGRVVNAETCLAGASFAYIHVEVKILRGDGPASCTVINAVGLTDSLGEGPVAVLGRASRAL